MRITILLVFVICCVLIEEVRGARLQNCDYCVKVLQCVYGQMGRSVRSKRLLESKLTHTCKRYPEYRKSCLAFSKAHLLKIFDDMQPEKYDPHRTCREAQECDSISLFSVNEQEGRSVEALNLSGGVSILTFLFMVFIFLHLPLYFLSQ